MTKEEKLKLMEDRLAKLEGNPKDLKCPGVTRRVRREVNNLRKELKK